MSASLDADEQRRLDLLLADAARRIGGGGGPVLVLTGAGISAESGIPTFRGEEGYWRVGSRNYRPTELATAAAFEALPDEVWGWYLYRRAVCRAAQPNAAHKALVALERELGERFLLVTQNVDGLHLRAGQDPARTYQIHGNIDLMRCAATCTTALFPLPEALGATWEKGRLPGEAERRLLACPACGGRARPHVLWFDEAYDETWFRFQSSQRAAATASLLLVVGTSGATTLASLICETVAARGAPMIVIDPDVTPFGELAASLQLGLPLRGSACDLVPRVCAAIGQRLRHR